MPFEFTLCADDYGMTAGVSRGILDVAQAGCISAASAMTNMPDWRRAAAAWRAAAPAADLGLHVNLTLGATRLPRLLDGRAISTGINMFTCCRACAMHSFARLRIRGFEGSP